MPEQRVRRRFRIHLPLTVSWSTGTERGESAGTLVEISGDAATLWSGKEIPLGSAVRVSIAWPVLLNESCRLRLAINGMVVRVTGRLAVVTVDRHEFRTAGLAHGATDAPACDLPSSLELAPDLLADV